MASKQDGASASQLESTPKIPFLVVLGLCTPLAFVAHILAYIDPSNRNLVGLDFRAFYAAGKMLLDNARIYDLSQQWAWQKALWPELVKPSELLYIPYPPFDILPMALVAQLPLHLAYTMWLVAQTLLLGTLLYLLVNSSDDATPRTRLILLVFCLSSLPVLLTLVHGQLSFMLAISALLSWRNFKSGHDRRGGLWLSFLLIKPQFFFLPLLLLLFLRRRRALEGLACGSLALLALSVFLVGFDGIKDYVLLLANASQWGEKLGIHPQAMHSWRSFLYQLMQTNDASRVQLLWIAGVAITLGVLAWSWRNAWQPNSPVFDLSWALLLIGITFCSPHTNVHDLCLLLVSGVLITNCVTGRAAVDFRGRGLLLAMPIAGFITIWLWFSLSLTGLRIITFTVLFQIVAMVILLYSCRKLNQPQPTENL